MIRNYTNKDFYECVKIVDKVWDFYGRFDPPDLAELFLEMYTGASLSASNFAVVVEENGVIKGFLFGKCGDENIIQNDYSGVLGSFRFLFKFFLLKGVKFKKKLYYIGLINQHEKNRRKVESERINEVNLFAVDAQTQGKGYGKALMNEYIKFCKDKKVNRITLDTDKECNYGFYEYFGYKVKGEFYSPLQKEYSGKSGESYVYELILDK